MRLILTLILGVLSCGSSLAADTWLNWRGNPYHTSFVPKWHNWNLFSYRWAAGFGTVTYPYETVAFNGTVYHTRYFYGGQSFIWAINELTGAIKWEHLPTYGLKITQPVAWNGDLYYLRYTNSDNEIVKVNGQTGIGTTVSTFDQFASGDQVVPIVVNGVIYWNDRAGSYSYNVVTGLKRWQKVHAAVIFSNPVISGNAMIFYGRNETEVPKKAYLYVLYAGSGNLAFKLRDPLYVSGGVGQVTVGRNGNVYVATMAGLACFNVNLRQYKWTKSSVDSGIACIGNGRLYSVNNDVIYCYDEQLGTLLWSLTVGELGYQRSLALSNNLLFMSGIRKIRAYNIHTRAKVWEYEHDSVVESVLSLTEKTLFITGQKETHAISVPSVL